MRIAFRLFLLAAVSFLPAVRASAASAPNIPPGMAAEDPNASAAALVGIFGRLCLERFPERSVTDGETVQTMTPLTPEVVDRYLHGDPGEGWMLMSGGKPYVVTVEAPPFRACAVRRMYVTPPNIALPWSLLIQSWVTNRHLGPVTLPKPLVQDQSAMTITLTPTMLEARPSQPVQVLMEIGTVYKASRLVEERLVRQITPPRPVPLSGG